MNANRLICSMLMMRVAVGWPLEAFAWGKGYPNTAVTHATALSVLRIETVDRWDQFH